MDYEHVPVMLREVIYYLEPKEGGRFIDCTLGGAGYTSLIAEKVGPEGVVLGIDLDEMALSNAEAKLKRKGLNNVRLARSNFRNLDTAAAAFFPANAKFDGIVFDLGLSSAQLDDESRGFSFKGNSPLDMSFGPDNEASTEEIVNRYSLPELTRIFRDYGEDRNAYKIAKRIVELRRTKRIRTTGDLVSIVESVVPFRATSKIHPATKVFQALRMETNDEINAVEEALAKAEKMLKKGGKLVIVSFHSGEDRIVKNFLRDRKNSSFRILTKKPVSPTDGEVDDNYRSRSAKLRAAEKN